MGRPGFIFIGYDGGHQLQVRIHPVNGGVSGQLLFTTQTGTLATKPVIQFGQYHPTTFIRLVARLREQMLRPFLRLFGAEETKALDILFDQINDQIKAMQRQQQSR